MTRGNRRQAKIETELNSKTVSRPFCVLHSDSALWIDGSLDPKSESELYAVIQCWLVWDHYITSMLISSG
jgi:hypothetical protein